MHWTRRKTADATTEYVSGRYVLTPCFRTWSEAEQPRPTGWDIRYGDQYLRADGTVRVAGDGSTTFSQTCRKLARAKEIAETHAQSLARKEDE